MKSILRHKERLFSSHKILDQKWVIPLIILLVVFVTHGLLFISDFRYWDDWPFEGYIKDNRWDVIYLANDMPALKFGNYFFRIFGFFADPIYASKVISFLCITCSGFVTFALLRRSGFFNRGESLMIVLVGITFPAVRCNGESYMFSMYLFCYLLFLSASYIAFVAETQNGWKHVFLRIIVIIGFLLSFHLGSLLVFFYGFFFVLMLNNQRLHNQRWFIIPWKWILRHIDYLMVPFVFWYVRMFLFGQWGMTSEYNYHNPEHALNFGRLLVAYKGLVFNVLLPLFQEGVTLIFGNAGRHLISILLFIFVILICYLVALLFRQSPQSLFSDTIKTKNIFFVGILFLFLGTYPYVATGYGFVNYGWFSRTSVLISLPLGIIILAFFRSVFYDSGTHSSRWMIVFFILMIFGFSATYIKTYITYQALSVKEHSFQYNLSQDEKALNYTVFAIKDEFGISQTTYEGSGTTPFFVYSRQIQYALGDKPLQRLGFSMNRYISSEEEMPINKKKIEDIFFHSGSIETWLAKLGLKPIYAGIDYSANKQCILTIKPGEYLKEFRIKYRSSMDNNKVYIVDFDGQLRLALTYWYYKMFNPDMLNEFLSQITSVDLKPL